MTRPDWASEADWEKAMADAAGLRNAVVWQSNAANEIIALALLSAKNEGKREAAEIAMSSTAPPLQRNSKDLWVGQIGQRIAQAILSSIEKEPK